jgi:hypothetical protein
MLCGCCLILINTLTQIQVPLPPVRSSQNLYFTPTVYANYSSSFAEQSFVYVDVTQFYTLCIFPAQWQSHTCKHVRPDALDVLKSFSDSGFLCRKQKK